jgi:glycosyltransferase involved in cell wall biosynthesis
MSMPFISYLVTTKNTGSELKILLDRLYKYGQNNECVILDDYSDDTNTLQVLDNVTNNSFFKVYKHKLDRNYSEHKNYGKNQCQGKYIFQIDDDEMPSETLLDCLTELIELNNDVDLFWIPRINIFLGADDIEAKKWGWRLTKIPELVKEKIIDDQSYEYKFLKNNGYILEETKISCRS